MLSESQLLALTELRHTLHRFPYISQQEGPTAERLLQFLKNNAQARLSVGVGGTAITAALGPEAASKALLIRGDLDALPIQETGTVSYKSEREGAAHMCGHDGHSTILCALAVMLSEQPPQHIQVVLLFQPAEENGYGARAVLESGMLNAWNFEAVYALHNLPGLPLHEVVCRTGVFNASVKSLILRWEGMTSHAAEPEQGNNPALAVAGMLEAAIRGSNNQPESPDFFIAVPVFATLGSKDYGISAGEGEVHLTLRSWRDDVFETHAQDLIQRAQALADTYQLTLSYKWTQEFDACCNHPDAVDRIKRVAQSLGLAYHTKSQPFRWGEDFGLLTRDIPGAMFGLGAGENTPALHNSDYDFPDELISTGSTLFHSLICIHDK